MNLISEDYLIHHGVKGMKWGVRNNSKKTKTPHSKQKKRLKNAVVIGGSIVATGLMIYGGYKVNNIINNKNLKTATTEGINYISVGKASIPRTQIERTNVSVISDWEDLAKKNKELFAKSLNR